MIPAEFDYFAPRTLAEAAELLARHPDAKLLGGGMSLIPALKHRLQQPSALIDLGRVAGLDGIARRGETAVIGARATHAAIARAPELARVHGLQETAAAIGDVQVRNRGTLGGSLVHADPAGDWPAAFLALEGKALLGGPRKTRTVEAEEFFTAMLTSATQHDEILIEVHIPVPGARSGSAYRKLRQPASGFALVGVAARISLDAQGRIERAAIGVTGVNPVPFRAASVENRLIGQRPDPAALRSLCAQVDEADPMEDLHASSEYRAHLVGVFAARAVAAAAEPSRGVKFDAQHVVPLAPADTAARLADPRALRAAVPGLASLEPRADRPDHFDAVLEVKLPAITGRFEGTLEIAERQPPERLVLRLAGKGALGFVNGSVALALTPEPAPADAPPGTQHTRVRYDADVQIGGTVARLGQRMLSGVTREMAAQFFSALARWNPERPDEKVAPSPTQSALGLAGRTALRTLGLRRDD